MVQKNIFTDYDIRQELSNYATAMFNGAKELTIHYQRGGAFIYASFSDRVREYTYIAYETIRNLLEQGQHGRALAMLGVNEEEMLPDSINYNNY